MTGTEQRFIYRGQEFSLAAVDCAACGNFFFVVAADEHQPVCCAYCGIKFIRYTDSDGTRRRMNGAEDEQP